MSRYKNQIFFIPDNVDIDKLIEEFPPPIGVKKENIIQIISTLITSPIYNSDNIGEDGSYPLSSQKLQAICRNYKTGMDYLAEVGIIECTKNYYTDNKGGGECKRYRICDKYNTPIKPIHIEFKKLPKNLIEKKKKADGKRRKARRTYPHLTKQFKYLRVDYEGAVEYLKFMFNSESRRDQTKVISALANLYNIKTRNFYYTVDDTGNRLHSNLTNLPKKLRKFLYCVVPGSDQKYPLEAVDIKNSQPFFSIIFFNNSLIHSSINNQHIIPPLLNTLNNSSTLYTILYNTLKHYSTLLIFNNTSIHYVSKEISIKSIKRLNTVNEEGYLGNINGQYDDIKRFSELVSNGTFYEEIEDLYKREGIDLKELFEYFNKKYKKRGAKRLEYKSDSRSNIKKVCMIIFFSRNGDYPELKEPFEKEFPNVYQTFQRIKESWCGWTINDQGDWKNQGQNNQKKNKSKKPHKKLPALLQRFEAHIILNEVCKIFTEKFPNVPVFTIHDNICVPAYCGIGVNYIGELKTIIEEEFLKIIGLSPMVHDEIWNPPRMILFHIEMLERELKEIYARSA